MSFVGTWRAPTIWRSETGRARWASAGPGAASPSSGPSRIG